MHYACKNGSLDLIKNLTKRSELDVTATDSEGMNILHIACDSANDINIIRFIVSLNKINVNDKSNDGNTPLLYLCNNYRSSGNYRPFNKFVTSTF